MFRLDSEAIMSRKLPTLIGIPALALLLYIPGCGGGGPHVLQSIDVSPNTAAGSTASYTATGNYSGSPMTVTPQPVSWYIMGPGIDPPPSGYTLAAAPYTGQRCAQFQAKTTEKYIVIAVAPVNPSAPNSGSVPTQVFDDLVIARTTTSEDGWVSATATLTCP